MSGRNAVEVLLFEGFVLDCRGLALYYAGERVELSGKPLRVLIYLACRAGKTVSPETLATKFWKHDPATGGDSRSKGPKNRLEQIIRRIRRAIGDKKRRLIVTEVTDGYVFTPTVLPGLRSDLPQRPQTLRNRFMDSLAQSFVVQQATLPDVRWAAQLAQQVYTGNDIIPESRMLEWYCQNSDGFSVVKSKLGELVANLDILPLKRNILDEFVAGRMTEREFSADCLHPPSESTEISHLYVESFVTIHPGSLRANRFAAAQILREFNSILGRICNPANLQSVYAIAASVAGRRLLKHLGFEICSAAEKRRDRHDLFSIQGSALADTLRERFGDGRSDEQTLRLFDDTDSEQRGL
jgi:DNA-binding winged helix-turn-helix (wHTH) protein